VQNENVQNENVENENVQNENENVENEIVENEIVEIQKPVLDGFNAEMESLYLELILEKKSQMSHPKLKEQMKMQTKQIQNPAKKQVAKNKAKATVLFQKQQLLQKQLQKAMAQNKQFQHKIGHLSKFTK
jgi:hypothetical protein